MRNKRGAPPPTPDWFEAARRSMTPNFDMRRYKVRRHAAPAPVAASGKVALAGRLRAEPVVLVSWIAARLRLGTAGYVNHLLYRWRQRHGK